MGHKAEKPANDKHILATTLWNSPGGKPYTLQNLIDDWASKFAVEQLPAVTEAPERAVSYIRGKFCAAVRASTQTNGAAPVLPATSIVTSERRDKGDLLYHTDTSGAIDQAQAVDTSVAAALLNEELLHPDHEPAMRRYRSYREAYDLMHFRTARYDDAKGTSNEERTKADDYLFIRKRMHQSDLGLVDYACFSPAQEWNFPLLRARAGKYVRAFDSLTAIMREIDDIYEGIERQNEVKARGKVKKPKETSCAGAQPVAP